MFKEGSIVNGAETDIDMDVEYVKVDSVNPNSSATPMLQLIYQVSKVN